MNELFVIGAGGHAKNVLGILRAACVPVRAVYDDDEARWGSKIMGVPILGPISDLVKEAGAPAIIAVGDGATRRRLSMNIGLRWDRAVHPRAVIDDSATIGPGTVVDAGAVVHPDAAIGAHVIILSQTSIGHDCRVADFSFVGHGCILAGGASIEEGAALGVGSVTIPGVTVGRWSTVGAGAVVTRDVPPRSVAISPALRAAVHQ